MPRLRPALLLAAVIAAAACSRVPLLSPNAEAVVGQWVVVRHADNDARYEERMAFDAAGSFRTEGLWKGFEGRPADEVTGYIRTRGRYRMDGDRLMLRVERVEQWQKYAVGANPTVTSPEPAWIDRGTVRVRGNQLYHTFVSAPADAPVTATVVYERER